MRRKFRKILVKLLRLNNTPHEIALGIAIGVFIAILPLYGLHTVLVIIAAVLIRPANKIAILIGTNVSLPPTVATITWTSYDIGRFILKSHNYPPLVWADFKTITLQKIAKLYPPLFLGSVILGIACAVAFYFITYFIVKSLKNKRHARKYKHKKI